jgi:putative transposase
MSDTYTQLYIQIVFAPKYRQALLKPEWEERLRMYISAIVRNNGHKLIAINNMADHLHLLVGLNPKQSISDMMRLIKGDSSEWINKERLTTRKFQWQEGYGAFSYSKSQIDAVVKYIENQQEHHKKITFLDEYKNMLEKFEVEYKESYIFKLPEE